MPPFDLGAERERPEGSAMPCSSCELGEQAFCHGLPAESVRKLGSILGQTTVDPNTTIFREGDPSLHLYSIAHGAVKLYKLLSDGRRQITAFLFPGDFFGLSKKGGYVYTAEAMTPLTLCRFPRRKLEVLFDDIPQLEKRLLGATIFELAAAHEQMLLLGRKTAREKVATFLGMLSHRLGEKEPAAMVHLPMSRSDIADYLGLTIETVSRTLTAFKREGLIALPDASHVAIRQADAVERLAEGS